MHPMLPSVGIYEHWILPRVLDFAMRQPPIMKQREKVVPLASGRVLEIGMGSGLNLSYYDKGKLEKLWGLEPSEELRELARERARAADIDVEFIGLTGEEIPMDSGQCDSVVVTYTLCTIPDAVRALREMRRVLKPGGQLIFTEHGKAPDLSVRKWQDRVNGAWGKISGGCNLNRDVPQMIYEGGLKLETVETMYLPGPRPMTYNYWGTATPT
jgi:ubiquinone/menaquinone biosynthesis C-methylase UbiE